ncbi:MAG: hypothetical protein BWY21_02192 [Parcubacteria group bacterium ADurb.Bin216]|nr:MAG: hypothetical protein BWY21_02192 [Parcubacteria group bacterium ADurb.Bin216]
MVPNIRVAKPGKNLKDNNIEEESINTSHFMPKIVVQKQIATDQNTPATTTHGLSYSPVCIRYVRDYTPEGAYKIMPFGAIGMGNEIDNTYIYGYYGEVYNPNTELYEQPIYYSVIFSDSINNNKDETPNGQNQPELFVKSGQTTNPIYKLIVPYCDYLKASTSGILTLNIPSSNLNDSDSQEYSSSYLHNKGYIPIVAPFDTHFDSFLLNSYYEGGSNIPSTIILNNIGSQLVEQTIPAYSASDVYEYITYYFNGIGLYLEYTRLNLSGETQNCPARTIKLYYTIFENQLDESLNLL